MTKLNISEIFYSLQGEAAEVGLPTVFIRLIGCPLRCKYCDTKYAFYGNNLMTIANILQIVKKYNTNYVCITGGEPLAQKNISLLIDKLIVNNYNLSIETSGSIDVSWINNKAIIVMDIKTPSSGENDKNLLNNLSLLKNYDQIKFVIGNENDFNWSCNFLTKYQTKANILFSPVADKLAPKILADWILSKQLTVRLQLQLHKILWGNLRAK